ncbi:DUF4044 domain-containing protein [Vagococcus acidifermentans]|nr:DUF4044 domain-containing protein [Vagococcus acidifermentans]
MNKKEKSTFAKVTSAVIWIMLIAMIGSIVIGALSILAN